MRLGIAYQLSAVVLLLVAGVGGALGAFSAREQATALERELDRRVALAGAQLAAALARAVEDGDAASLDRILTDAALDPEVAYVVVKTPDGEARAGRWTPGTRGAVTEYAFPIRGARRVAGSPDAAVALFGTALAPPQGDLLATVAVGVDLSGVRGARARLYARTAAAVATAALAAALLGVALVRHLLRRALGPLLSGIRDVAGGDLGRRIRPAARGDDIAETARAFDEMADRLSATLVTKRDLEDAVVRRTAELRGALEDREHAQRELADREERLRLLLESTAEAIYGIDLSGRCTFCNPACLRLLGYGAPADLVGRNMHAQIHHSTPDGAPAAQEECPIFRTLQAGKGHHATEDVFWRADGTPLAVEWRSYPVFRGAELMGAVITFLDVSERKQLEAAVLQARKLESLGVLAGGIAHDFNNLLTGILGNVSLAKECVPAGGEARELLDEAEAATLRTRELTRQLLTFSKGGAPVKRPIALRPVLEQAARFALSGSAVRGQFTFAPDAWPVEADAGQLGQVIHNLVINAVQAMPGGGTLSVSTEPVELSDAAGVPLPPGRYVRIAVSDTGAGIAPEHLHRVFDPYFSTKAEGSGLGLATVYSIVKNHGGHVGAASAPGRGATFTIHLPASARGAREAPPGAAPAPRGAGRVLVMDDEAPVRAVARAMLSRLGYDVLGAATGEEAVALYREARREGRPFDVVLMDLTVVGGMGGEEALRQLRAIDPAVRAVVASGYSNDPVMARHREHGFVGLVAKPFTLEDLARAVAEARAAAA